MLAWIGSVNSQNEQTTAPLQDKPVLLGETAECGIQIEQDGDNKCKRKHLWFIWDGFQGAGEWH